MLDGLLTHPMKHVSFAPFYEECTREINRARKKRDENEKPPEV